MKKNFLFIVPALLFAASCSQNISIDVPEDPTTPEVGNVVLLDAILPEFASETKTTFTDAGVFNWEDGDVIAVKCINASSNEEYVDFTYNSSKGKFEKELETGYTVAANPTAYYPASYRGAALAGSFSTIDDAKKGFAMSATWDSANSRLAFQHDCAMVKLSFENVPDFAATLSVTGGAENVDITLDSKGDIDVYVPVFPAGTAADIHFVIKDSANNTIVGKKQKSKNLSAGTLYLTPTIPVSVIVVGVIDYIYESWAGHDSGWKLYYYKDADLNTDLISLGTTQNQSVGGAYWSGNAQKFYMFYTPVPSGISKFKVYWTNGSDSDWFGEDATSDKTEAYVFEYGSSKLAYYE